MDRGAYRLFIIGLELEALLKSKLQAQSDDERNLPLDGDLLFSLRSLIIAHAGLITPFPDARQTGKELDQYRELSESIDMFRVRVLDSVIEQLALSVDVFDDDTKHITEEIKLLNDSQKPSGQTPTQGEIAVTHSWVRGALASIGNYLLKQAGESMKVLRDALIKESVSHPDKLTMAIAEFLRNGKEVFLSLAHSFQSTFGWLETLLSHLGIR
jgi:hypothetical protein